MTMIELADAALESWLATLDPPVDIGFDRPGDDTGKQESAKGGKGARPVMSLVLTSVREQTDKRDNQVDDVRATDGRVIARQRSTRFFELDYLCSVAGPAREAHRALGDLVQLLVDHDVVPDAHVPEELRDLGYPLDVQLVAPAASVAAITLRLVLPVQPTPEREIGPPTTSLHLDMAPPPGRKRSAGEPAPATPDLPPVGERKWTTVRRRELIGRQEPSNTKGG